MATPRMRSPLRSPLGRAIGLGSAKEGVEHWWAQRITALALVPLALWFVVAIIALAGADRALLVDWLRHPIPAVLLVLLRGPGRYQCSAPLWRWSRSRTPTYR